MTRNKNEKAEKVEFELNDETLDQVTGGFNPQPDPPGKNYSSKFNQYLTRQITLPVDKVTVPKA